MKYSVALVTLAATLAVAQDLSTLPGCALKCGTENLASTKCSLTDTACLCNDTGYQAKVQACVVGANGCKGDDVCKAATWAAGNCKKAVPAGICPDKGKPAPPPGGSKPPPPPPSHGGEPKPAPPCYGGNCGGHDGGDSGEEPTKPCYGDDCGGHDGGDSGEEPTEPCYGDDCGADNGGDSGEEAPPTYGAPAPAESSAAAEPTTACENGESGEGATPVPDSYEAPATETAAAPCVCATGGAGAGTVPYGSSTPAEESSDEAGIPVTTVELPCATETAPVSAQEPVPAAAETPCPTLSTRPYPPPVDTGAPVPAPAESGAAGIPTYGGDNTNSTGGVPAFESSGNKMVTFSSLGAGFVALAMLVAF